VDIHKAVESGNIEAVKQAIADGVDVEVKDAFRRRSLILRFVDGHIKRCRSFCWT